jgi:rfaE bifunctional protein nucleotidyltransferase chain/domain/rfaE bifunctional protein kinase chain/domain
MGGGPLIVVGDTLLDVDLEGSSERLCPDAPVPVVDLRRRWLRPGGAGLTALLAARAGVPVVLVTGIARDEDGDTLLTLLGAELEVLPQQVRGTTVVKTRVRTTTEPLLRLDTGNGVAGAAPLTSAAARAITRAGAVLVSDYGRGMAGQPELRDLLRTGRRHVPLVWDPHPRGADPLPGANLITPNESEAERVIATGAAAATAPCGNAEHVRGHRLCEHWDAAAVAVTVGERGALLTERHAGATVAVDVAEARAGRAEALDTCGAGDRFAGAAAGALRLGHGVRAAVECGVEQAARYVAAGGASASSALDGLLARTAHREPSDLATLIERTRRTGGRVVATGGCFDLLHRGHVNLLEQAARLGDLLVVCLNSDSSVRRAKGPSRPVVGQEDRSRVLAALNVVDAVAIFDEDTPSELLGRIRPDVWVKGSDYTDQPMPEAEVVRSHGGRVVLLPLLSGYSTTRMVDSAALTATAG